MYFYTDKYPRGLIRYVRKLTPENYSFGPVQIHGERKIYLAQLLSEPLLLSICLSQIWNHKNTTYEFVDTQLDVFKEKNVRFLYLSQTL